MSHNSKSVKTTQLPELKSPRDFKSWEVQVKLIKVIYSAEKLGTDSQPLRLRLHMFQALDPKLRSSLTDELVKQKLELAKMSEVGFFSMLGDVCRNMTEDDDDTGNHECLRKTESQGNLTF